MATAAAYPLRVEAQLDEGLSRWLWLVKWVLAIPHFIVLAFLWIAYSVLTVVAFFAILLTGRYPHSIFEFNVGVIRWTWRVSYYSFGTNGTDQYPPFTLQESPDYPTRLQVAYPEQLSRWLPLVKWFLAIPHLVIVAILAGGGSVLAWNIGQGNAAVWGNLIGVLVLVAVVILLFTGTYPRALFDLILGLNRWVLRVAAYVGLMTDEYPPFRLDMGGTERGNTLTIPRPPGGSPSGEPAAPEGPMDRRSKSGWTGGRITTVVIGSLLLLVSLGLLGGGGFTSWMVATQRDPGGFYTIEQRLTSGGYALTAEVDLVRERGSGWPVVRGPGWTLGPGSDGRIRVRVTATDPGEANFLGVGPTARVEGYLDGVARDRVTSPYPTYETAPGTAPDASPASQEFWLASSEGTGTRTVMWTLREGSWTIVVMNASASRGIDVRAEAGATIPALPWIAGGLLAGGIVLLVGAVLLIVIPATRAGRSARTVEEQRAQ